jgi:hypothetical protein
VKLEYPVSLSGREREANDLPKLSRLPGLDVKRSSPAMGWRKALLIVSGGARDTLPMSYVVEADALEHNRIIPATSAEKSSRTLVGCGQVLPLRFRSAR